MCNGCYIGALIEAHSFAGKYVDLNDTVSSFKGILDGKYDDLPEQAFYMVGDIKEVEEKADKLAKEMANQ